MGYFPIQCNDPDTLGTRTVWVTKHDTGVEAVNERFTDRRGRSYRRDPNRPHGVVELPVSPPEDGGPGVIDLTD